MLIQYKDESFLAWLQGKKEITMGMACRLTGMSRGELRGILSRLEGRGEVEGVGEKSSRVYRVVLQPTTEQPQRTRSRSRRRKTPRNAAQAPMQAPATTEALEAAATPPQVPMPPPPPTIEEVPTPPAPTLEEPVVEEKCPEGVSPFRFYAQKYGLDLDDVQRRQQTKVTERVEVVLPKSHDGRPPLSVIKGGGA